MGVWVYMRWHAMALRAWDGAYVGTNGLARGRSHAIRPWPDQQAYEGNDGAAKETLAIYLWQILGTDVHENFKSRRRAVMAIS